LLIVIYGAALFAIITIVGNAIDWLLT